MRPRRRQTPGAGSGSGRRSAGAVGQEAPQTLDLGRHVRPLAAQEVGDRAAQAGVDETADLLPGALVDLRQRSEVELLAEALQVHQRRTQIVRHAVDEGLVLLALLGQVAVGFAQLGGPLDDTLLQFLLETGRDSVLVIRYGDARSMAFCQKGTPVRLYPAEGEEFPAVHAGADFGPATNRAGDWFGPPVNVASRVTDLAKPGRILVTEGIEQRVGGLAFKRRRKRSLAGVEGRVRLFELASNGAGPR